MSGPILGDLSKNRWIYTGRKQLSSCGPKVDDSVGNASNFSSSPCDVVCQAADGRRRTQFLPEQIRPCHRPPGQLRELGLQPPQDQRNGDLSRVSNRATELFLHSFFLFSIESFFSPSCLFWDLWFCWSLQVVTEWWFWQWVLTVVTQQGHEQLRRRRRGRDVPKLVLQDCLDPRAGPKVLPGNGDTEIAQVFHLRVRVKITVMLDLTNIFHPSVPFGLLIFGHHPRAWTPRYPPIT